jgi:predicted TIM-barrel fold metal-dependent hydrolase
VGSFNPTAYSNSIEVATAARSELQDNGFIGVKLHPALNRYDPLDPQVMSFLDELADWSRPLPVWLCTYFYYKGGVLRKTTVDTIYEIVGRYPTVSFILTHAAGPDILRLAHAVRSCPNAFLELSFTLTRYLGSSVETDIRYLLQTFDQRMLHGSDFPEVSLTRAATAFDAVSRDCELDARERVLGLNLREILEGVVDG